jgi:hypothetical protein
MNRHTYTGGDKLDLDIQRSNILNGHTELYLKEAKRVLDLAEFLLKKNHYPVKSIMFSLRVFINTKHNSRKKLLILKRTAYWYNNSKTPENGKALYDIYNEYMNSVKKYIV